MAKAKLDEGNETVVEETEAFYHFGLLPATGKVTLWLPSKTEMKEEERAFNAYDLWNGGERGLGDVQMFTAKARQFNGLTVRGFHFHATSQSAVARGGEINRTDYPGQVVWMSPEKVQAIVKACHRAYIHWEDGGERRDDVRCKAYIYDMDWSKRPEWMTDEEWAADRKLGAKDRVPAFNPREDKLVAEFVYITRLDYDRSKLDRKEYRHNPNKYHAQMVPSFSRDWFENPPKSVAEMYPEGGK